MTATRRSFRAAPAPRLPVRGNAVAHVYATLRKEILSLRLAPGSDLNDATLVDRTGLSRTPIREALARLAGDGLVVQSPNRGFQVAPINLMELPRFVEALDLLQRAVLRAAALRRTGEDLIVIDTAFAAFGGTREGGDAFDLTQSNHAFHAAIAQAGHNRYLADSYIRLLDEGMRMLSVPFAYDPEEGPGARAHIARVDAEHREIVKAIRQRDAKRAEALGASHAELFRSRFLAYLEGNPMSELGISRLLASNE